MTKSSSSLKTSTTSTKSTSTTTIDAKDPALSFIKNFSYQTSIHLEKCKSTDLKGYDKELGNAPADLTNASYALYSTLQEYQELFYLLNIFSFYLLMSL